MKKKVFGIILTLIIVISFASCDGKNSNIVNIDNVLATPNSKLVDFELVDCNWYEAILVDKTTGVMYVWFTTDVGGITPLYNTDGTLKIYNE